MLGQLVAAQFDLETVLAELERSGLSTDAVRSNLQALGYLQRQIGTANPATLTALRGEVAAGAATSRAVAQQSRVTATTESASEKLADAITRSRAVVDSIVSDVFDRRIFDPYLRFGSTDEEAAYRQREADRRALIEAERAKGTPQGDLNASGAAVGQMADAYAHGDGYTPVFRQRWNVVVEATARLRAAAHANGISTEEFDRRLREDLRAIMRSKGIPDAQIDAHFAANPDPLEAARAFVDCGDIAALRRSTENAAADATRVPNIQDAPAPLAGPRLSDVLANLQSAGIVMTEVAEEDAPNHGVTAAVAALGTSTGRGSLG